MENVEPSKFLRDGQRKRCLNGYIVIDIPERGIIYEHRYIMEQKLGRFLESNECVHHINHDKTDNRIENLELFSSNSSHLLMHGLEQRHKRLENVSEIPIDTSNRSCFMCGSTETHRRKDRNYRPAWRTIDGKPICETCRGRKRREKLCT